MAALTPRAPTPRAGAARGDDGEVAEAVLRAACDEARLPALLLQLRMRCRPELTRIYRYEEELLRSTSAPAAPAPGRPKPPDRLWRLRTAFDAGLEKCGGDAADRPFWPDGLAETDGETALVLAGERWPPKPLGAVAPIRVRLASELAAVDDAAEAADFLASLGFRKRGQKRRVSGRLYYYRKDDTPEDVATVRVLLADDVAADGSAARAHAGYLVELAADLGQGLDADACARGLVALRDSLPVDALDGDN